MFGHFPPFKNGKKNCGKHPTQKPLSVLIRIILASTNPNAWILDPFTGGSTTGISANLLKRRFVGIDIEEEFLQLSQKRKLEIENPIQQQHFIKKMQGFSDTVELSEILEASKKSD